MINNLIYHYQNVIYNNSKTGMYLHEAFSTRSGELYSINPIPVEVSGDTQEEVEEVLRAMEADTTRYKPVTIGKIKKQIERWVDEVEISSESVLPEYDDEEALEEDYYKKDGEVFDLCEFLERNK